MKGMGLVLAGGGGKGAYQIGVWKYLHEYGLDQYVQGVSGTSVGALNAALFVSGNYEKAERLWLDIEPQQILSPRKFSAQDILHWTGMLGGTGSALVAATNAVPVALGSAFTAAFSAMLGRRYAFSREGLLQLMRDGVDFNALCTAPQPCFVTCLAIPQLAVRRFDIRNYTPEDTQSILLASSAIPLIFDSVQFEGNLYCDGGLPIVGDNVPVTPIYEQGLEYIVVIHLSQETLVDRSRYPRAKIIEIVPRKDLGGPIDGTLDFTSKGAQWRIEQGYQDTKYIFDPFIQQILLQGVNEKLFQQAIQRQKEFEAEHQAWQERMNESRRRMETDGFNALYSEMLEKEN